jgi:hypothetical protein
VDILIVGYYVRGYFVLGYFDLDLGIKPSENINFQRERFVARAYPMGGGLGPDPTMEMSTYSTV